MRPLPRSLRLALDALLLMLGTLALLRSALLQVSDPTADLLYLPAFARDLLSGRAAGWILQPAPSFFPDLPLWLAASAAPGLLPAYLLHHLLCVLLLWLLAHRLARHAGAERQARARSASLAVFGFACLLLVLPGLGTLLMPGQHGPVLLLGGLALLDLVLDGRDTGRAGRSLALLLLATLASASDPILIPQVLLPLAIALPWAAEPGQRGPAWRLSAALLLAAAMGWLLLLGLRHGLLPGLSVPALRPALGRVPLGELVQGLLHALEAWARPSRMLWFTAGLLACAAAWRSGHPWKTLARFTALSWALTLAAALLSGFLGGDRYYHPLLLWPWLWLLMGLAWLQRGPTPALALLAGPLLLIMGALAALPGLRLLPVAWPDPYPTAVRGLDELAGRRALHHGYSNYYWARRSELLSRKGLRLAQLLPAEAAGGQLAPYRWLNRPAEAGRGEAGRFPRYTFVLIEGLPKDLFLARFGAPAWRELLQGGEVWGYDRPQDLGFRNFLRKHLHYAEGQAQLTLPASPPQLAAYPFKARSAPDQQAHFVLHPGRGLSLRYGGDQRKGVLELLASGDLELTWRLKGKALARLRKDFGPVLDERYLAVPEPARAHGFDELLIRGRGGSPAKLGYAFLYDDAP